MEDIKSLRISLELINHSLMKLITARREKVSLIREVKKSQKAMSFYDKAREQEVFASLNVHLAQMDLKEVLAYSLLVESHIQGETSNYPSWSKGEHLNSFNNCLYEMVNPNLIELYFPELFKELDLKSDF